MQGFRIYVSRGGGCLGSGVQGLESKVRGSGFAVFGAARN